MIQEEKSICVSPKTGFECAISPRRYERQVQIAAIATNMLRLFVGAETLKDISGTSNYVN
jgi:hypothetical protein